MVLLNNQLFGVDHMGRGSPNEDWQLDNIFVPI